MIKDIKYYMSDTEQSFEDFLKSCDDLIYSKYILADGKIASILQHIASSKKTYELFDNALKSFDFGYEFSLAKQPTGYNTETIKLPKNKKKAIAFVFCLLLEFDMGQRKLKDFLHVYFFNDNPNNEFATFIREVIVPFKAAASELFYNPQKEELALDEEPDRTQAPEREKQGGDCSLDALLSELGYISDRVAHTKLGQQANNEIVFTLNALIRAVSGSDTNAVKLCYIAFKNTLYCIDELSFLRGEAVAFGKKLLSMGCLEFA